MGPEGNESPENRMLQAPRLTPAKDKFYYRSDVRMWMRRVRVFANGGDTKAKGVANGLGHALYSAMDLCYRRVLDADMQDGKLKLDLDDDEAVMTFSQQRSIVEQMLMTVAKDSPTDAAKRMITLGRRVFNCRRFRHEDYATFAERFRGVAQAHLNCFRHIPTEQEKQQTALIMLENAQLPDSIYNNLLSLLVSKQENPTRQVSGMNNRMESEQFEELKTAVNKAMSNIQSGSLEDAKLHTQKAKEIINEAESRINRRVMDDGIQLTFGLEDAIAALKTIRVSDSETRRSEHTDNARNVASIGSMIASGHEQYPKQNGGYITPGTGAKLNTRCHACNGANHWAGDPQCPMYGKGRKDTRISKPETGNDLRSKINNARNMPEHQHERSVRFTEPPHSPSKQANNGLNQTP